LPSASAIFRSASVAWRQVSSSSSSQLVQVGRIKIGFRVVRINGHTLIVSGDLIHFLAQFGRCEYVANSPAFFRARSIVLASR